VKDRETIASELQTIAEELNDLSMRLLSDAIEAGHTTRPLEEKSVSQARRAVEKAIHHRTSHYYALMASMSGRRSAKPLAV